MLDRDALAERIDNAKDEGQFLTRRFHLNASRPAIYIFWNTGTGKPQTAVTNWQHDLRQVFRAAGQPDGHLTNYETRSRSDCSKRASR